MNAIAKTEVQTIAPANQAMTPMEMLSAAIDNGATVEMIDKLMTLQERWEANQGRKAFDNAIAAAKAEIPVIIKARVVDFTGKTGIRTHYHYEDLAVIAETINPILANHGLSYRYRTGQESGRITVTCIISHREGYSEETSLSAGADESGNKNNIQAVGSTITYLQRMTLKAALGLAAARDDDGQASAKSGPISDAQYDALLKEVERVSADLSRFEKAMGVETLADLPAAHFDAAMSRLAMKGQKNG
jgi:hypothetical protein